MLDYNENINPAPVDPTPQSAGPSSFDVDYVANARQALENNDRVLAMHLYLAAYEKASEGQEKQNDEALDALRRAWDLSCELRERSIAEYVYEKIEPYLSDDELEKFTVRLQDLALDKLSEFGISRNDLNDITDMISEELNASVKLGSVTPLIATTHSDSPDSVNKTSRSEQTDQSPQNSEVPSSPGIDPDSLELVEIGKSLHETLANVAKSAAGSKASHTKGSAKSPAHPVITYRDLVGFDQVIEDALAYGIGVNNDADMKELLDVLRTQHGLEKLSAYGSIIFRTSSREDAGFFMAATVGELDLPAMRVQMQPGPQGVPILAVSVSADRQPRITPNRMTLDAPSVLVLEDIDLWGSMLLTAGALTGEESPHSQQAVMSRAARDALTVIHAAVENPDVYVLASLSGESEDQSFLYEMLEPMHIIDIFLPTDGERREIWDMIAQDHPSIRHLDFGELTRLSKNISRTDIISSAREAIEDAYRGSLKARSFVAVSKEIMYSHLANYQPLDSTEYQMLENAIVDSFNESLSDDLDELLGNEESHDN